MKSTLDHSPLLQQTGHSSVVTSVAFAPDGRRLASGSWDGTIKLWDVHSGKLKPRWTLRGDWDEVEAVAFTPDGAIAGLGTGWDGDPFGAVMVWTPRSTRGRSLVRVHGKLDTIAFAPDGRTLATGGADGRAVTLWNAATGRERTTLADHRGPIWSVAYSPAGTLLAVATGVVPAVAERSGDDPIGEIQLWDLDGTRPARGACLVGHEYGIISVTFSPDGKTLASGGFDRTVKLWGVATGQEWATLQGHDGWVAAVDFSPDGSILASGSHDHTIKLWDATLGRELATLVGHTGNVYSVAFSPDGTLLASGSLDGSVRLWDVSRLLHWKIGA